MKNHRTVSQEGQHEIIIKKSRFICAVKRTQTEQEARRFIDTVKKEHWKASHNCSAYIVGPDGLIQRASDDGEPSGTAGIPMLEVLKKNNLTDLTAVVTRYFGGTKLGAGGLIRAYGKAVSETLSAIGIVEKQLHQYFDVTVAYPVSGKIQNALQQSPYRIEAIDYTDQVSFTCLVGSDHIEPFKASVIDWTSDQYRIEKGPQAWIEVPVTFDQS
ncbi:protein co-occurring with transport systems [Alkalibacterium sp. AK22]|uniref:YigZ family protein n=1 Tax=Alkalibacterium sp. AK22 TaxID=1229520 RepID=UPI0004503559|nr:YigZ family protein [Alkalibacterium sp. AK22]EXJ23669.1 protein co-occurring with transport systems [Alkalibacterium sp. AK22]